MVKAGKLHTDSVQLSLFGDGGVIEVRGNEHIVSTTPFPAYRNTLHGSIEWRRGPCWRCVPDSMLQSNRHPDGLHTHTRPQPYPLQFTDYRLTHQIVAVLRGDSNVKGTVTFEQADENSNTKITWNISGHDANAERGMHVHAFGDNTNGCTSAGPHCMSIGLGMIGVNGMTC
jgi:hypothetical protein